MRYHETRLERFRRWWSWNVDGLLVVIVTIIVAGVALIGWLIWTINEDAKAWKAFAAEHECKIVAHMSGSTVVGNTISVSGKVGIAVGSTPDKTAYFCNDGITYWR